MHDVQDEAIGGQLEPEMGGAAAPPNPQPPPPRTYADKISMSELRLVCTSLCCMVALHLSTAVQMQP